jgi:peptidoglycan/LPS O-acetylase OafA/YrhL
MSTSTLRYTVSAVATADESNSLNFKLGYRPWLDGLRGLAILAVICYHADPPLLDRGMLGVELFFVLSGFLITSLLLEERATRGRISFRNFYARRFFRLFPPLP